ncbi:MAG: pentapeptide repeat-containing protein [Alphaproteobacteria bacterium]|nr:pentapeptide repeat-containing protein [Alphaproteobacteria bacterium]
MGGPPKETDLERLEQADLDDIIRKHADFVHGIRGGARAVVKFKDLTRLDFKGADLSQADFTGSILSEANLTGGTFRGTSFFACDMRHADLEGACFSRADFRGAYVMGANLAGADLKGADLREGKVMERGKQGVLENRVADTRGAGAHKTVFAGANLTETDMSGSRAHAADFTDADLAGVVVKDADFSGVDFSGANLSAADFTGSNLEGVNMHAAIMSGTVLHMTETTGANFSEALTDVTAGQKFEENEKPLSALLADHTAWIATAGRKGERLDLSGYDMRGVVDLWQYPLTAVKAIGATFLHQNLHRIEMQSALLDRADFRDAGLAGADLRGSSLKGAMMTRADLSEAQAGPLRFTDEDGSTWLQRINLAGANMRYAILRGADFRDAIMTGVDLSYAVLIDCDLRRADLSGAILDGADLSGALLQGTTISGRHRG